MFIPRLAGRGGQQTPDSRTPDSPAIVGSTASGAPELDFGFAAAATPIDAAGGTGDLDFAESLGKGLQAMKLGEKTEQEGGVSSSTQRSTQHKVPSQVSIGTVGHPVSCGPACRYVKRKGGCRDGTSCSSCHLCFWVRGKAQDEQQTTRRSQANARKPISSVGTVGHPVSCREPCLLAWSEGGCPFGSSCQQCHRCTPGASLGTTVTTKPSTATLSSRAGDPMQAGYGIELSVGSYGHPVSCAEACKYARKPKGCKDGRFCTRCHLCQWHRHPPPTELPSTRWESRVIHESL